MTAFTLHRRTLLGAGVLLASAPSLLRAQAGEPGPATAFSAAPLHWLEGQPGSCEGVTWGTPWPKGQVPAASGFSLRSEHGNELPVQSWPLAYWPDGSLKWSGHATGPLAAPAAGYRLQPAAPASAAASRERPLAWQHNQQVFIDTGVLRCTLPLAGPTLITEVQRQGHPSLENAHLVVQVKADPEGGVAQNYRSELQRIVIEQAGPLRAVIALHGSHRAEQAGDSLLPFIVRLYAYAGSDALRLVHTLVVDAEPAQHFISAVGLRFDAPQQGELHDRHVRFVSAEGGVFAEAVRGLTGLRRNAGEAALQAQVEGKATGPVEDFADNVAQHLKYVPAFGTYRLLQATPDGYQIHKRTQAGCSWLHSASGQRAAGVGYLGSPEGGVVFGVRNFWQSYPGQLDIEHAHLERARITLWLWAPLAAPMDLRPYHDGLGETDFTRQREALEITYEDYEPGFNTSLGIARTSELVLQCLPATPSAARLVQIAQRIQAPPQLLPPPKYLHKAGVFGPCWAPPERQTPREQAVEAQLAWYFAFYRDEVEQRKWYGFWDYGDVMHTYDGYRRVWRYDVGGYAWDNSELSTDLWLWYYFLRSGRADVFRMAEAMTRHTGEVDVHHLGRFAPLGSRHNVQHWGDSAKQLRISTAANRRFLYYLTADERIGELLDEQVDALHTLREVVPGRKVGQPLDPREGFASINFGTDWGAIAAAWLTAWERSGDLAIAQRLRNSMDSIAAQPHGFFTGVATMELASGRFEPASSPALNVSHLSAVFGLAEVCGELIELLPSAAFEMAWLDYCRLYNATPAERTKVLGEPLGNLNLAQGHARLTAYAGYRLRSPALQAQAWKVFFKGDGGIPAPNQRLHPVPLPRYLYPLLEPDPVSLIDAHSDQAVGANLSTNAVAQWSLAAMALLAMDPAPR